MWDWAVGFFKTFVIVFLVYLKFVRPGDSIENVITEQTPVLQELNVTEKRVKQILETFGNCILMLLNGLDEHALGQNRDVEAILKGRTYLFCNFLLTSRPHSKKINIEEHFKAVVRVDGFTYHEGQKFASNLLNKDRNKVKSIMNLKLANIRWMFHCTSVQFYFSSCASFPEKKKLIHQIKQLVLVKLIPE